MDAHEPDRIALVFGLVFTIVGAVTLVGLAGAADIDGGAALGASMVLAALLVAVVSLTSLRDRHSAVAGADVGTVLSADRIEGEDGGEEE